MAVRVCVALALTRVQATRLTERPGLRQRLASSTHARACAQCVCNHVWVCLGSNRGAHVRALVCLGRAPRLGAWPRRRRQARGASASRARDGVLMGQRRLLGVPAGGAKAGQSRTGDEDTRAVQERRRAHDIPLEHGQRGRGRAFGLTEGLDGRKARGWSWW